MDQRVLRSAWLGVFGAIVVLPALLWFAVSSSATDGATTTLWSGLSTITGLLALSALVCAAVLPSRIRSLNRAFGIQNVVELHRFTGVTSAVLVLVHLACVVAADPSNVALLDLSRAPGAAQAAVGATVALVLLVAWSVLRRRADSYELWRSMHLTLAVVVLVLSALHVWLLDNMVRDPAMGALLGLVAAVVAVVFVQRWVLRTLCDSSTEFLVQQVRRENDTVSTLVLEPRRRGDGPAATWAFSPGQFAWIRLERSPTAEEHPFTIASSAHAETTEFTIRHAGDFTRAVRRLAPGAHVWVDGPHGAFTNDRASYDPAAYDRGTCAGFVLVAGGVGVTPMMSMIRTAAHRGDRRSYRLVVVASAPEDLLFRAELAELRRHLDLEVTEVLRRPHQDWSGYTGGVDSGLLSAVIGATDHPEDLEHFVCGPPAMVNDVLHVLDGLGVGPDRIHTEQFDFA